MADEAHPTTDPMIVEYDLYSPVNQEWGHHRVDYRRRGRAGAKSPAEQASNHSAELKSHEPEGWIRNVRLVGE